MIHSKNQDKGFTLVELLIVIVILGILATVTVFAVGGLTDQAETTSCEVELKSIRTAAAGHQANNRGAEPVNADDLLVFVEDTALAKFTITYGPFEIADGAVCTV
jgi:prepilin-type N-terminal cleavage/methylation domain-containing protein